MSAAANSADSAPKRVVGRPFQPGQSGNPSGRPKSIAKEAQALVNNDPSRLLNVLLAIAEDGNAKDSDKIAATREYMDRAWGKAISYAPVEGGDPLELNLVDAAISRGVDELARKREAQVAGGDPAGAVAAHGQNGSARA